MKRFLSALKSMKLAIGLIAYLALTGILATLIPQGQDDSFYRERYPRLLAELILQSGFTRFFSSLLFILPSFAFFANLSACTVSRLLRELKKSAKRRHGPDILHLGLMVLVIGAIVSFSGRQEGAVQLAVGDKVELPEGRVLTLSDFSFERYPDGRPLDWTSTVDVDKDGKKEISAYPIRVNHPLKLGKIRLYQVSHSVERAAVFLDRGGKEYRIGQGEEFEQAGNTIFFMSADDGQGKAIFRVKDAAGASQVFRISPGEDAGLYRLSRYEDRDFTGLQAVIDPGYLLVLLSLILIGLGIFLTFIQKLGELHD